MSSSLSTRTRITSKLPVVADVNADRHTLSITQTLVQLETEEKKGLTDRQVIDSPKERLRQQKQEFGANELVATASRQWWQLLLDQFTNIMLVMLMVVTVVSGIFDFMEIQAGKASGLPFKDTIAILSIVSLNGILGYFQESRAEQALAALKQMAALKVRVLRDSKISEIDGRELVPGDVIYLEAGNQPAAGINTELGKIAALLQGVESQPTPLQQKLTQLGNVLVMGALVIVALTIIGGMLPDLLRGSFNLDTLKGLVKTSLSVAVAVVPEGLPAVITITLAMGTQRMVKRQALVRKLPAGETLGGVAIICSDKTGTLTQNKMVVQQVATLTAEYQIGGEGYIPNGDFQLNGESIEPLEDLLTQHYYWN